jgi:hypothetical protein
MALNNALAPNQEEEEVEVIQFEYEGKTYWREDLYRADVFGGDFNDPDEVGEWVGGKIQFNTAWLVKLTEEKRQRARLRMRQWKKDNKPQIKMLIAKAHRNIAAVERNICQFKVIINLGIEGIKNVPTAPSLADPRKVAAIKQGINKAVDEQKCAVELIKFFKTMIVCLSHAYNENITKANKYGAKLATELDVSRIKAMDDNERQGIKTSLDVVEKCLKMLPPVLVARKERDELRRQKAMNA